MKVLDLQCGNGHGFEGWFASEEDFVSQLASTLISCPACGDPSVVKKLSAPRLNLSHRRIESEPQTQPVVVPAPTEKALMAAWLTMARKIVDNTVDVGSRFAEEARKMHYEESDARGIRGTATAEETQSLIEEGIDVVPFAIPESLKEPLQ